MAGLRVLPYRAALAIGDPRALDFLVVLRKTHAEGPVSPDLGAISRFCWQPRHLVGGFLETFAMAEKEGVELAPRPLESEEGETSLPEWVSAESLITFHLQPKEFPPPGFFQPLLEGREDAEIILIQNLAVLVIVGIDGGMAVFREQGVSAASELLKPIFEKMAPKTAVPDLSAAPQVEMEDLDAEKFYAVGVLLPEGGTPGKRTTRIFGTPPALTPPAPPPSESPANAGSGPKLVIEGSKKGRARGDDPTEPLDVIRLATRDTSPELASIQPAVFVQGEMSQSPPRREPSETAIVKHRSERVMKAGRLDSFRLLWMEIKLAWLRRKMRRFAREGREEPPELLEKSRDLAVKRAELEKRLGLQERVQRETQAGRFSWFVSLLRRIRKW